MTLIGLAYNQKPEPTELASPVGEGDRQEDGELARPDEEPPSKIFALSIAELIARDEFAEWDAPATIAAVESALSRLGTVVRLEATEDFPERLRQTRPRLQHRRRLPWRESRGPRSGHLRVFRNSLLWQRSLHAYAVPRQGKG